MSLMGVRVFLVFSIFLYHYSFLLGFWPNNLDALVDLLLNKMVYETLKHN